VAALRAVVADASRAQTTAPEKASRRPPAR